MSLRAKRSNLLSGRSIASATLRSLQAVAGAPRTDRMPMGFRIGIKSGRARSVSPAAACSDKCLDLRKRGHEVGAAMARYNDCASSVTHARGARQWPPLQ